MPFRSKAQVGWMFANKPAMAKRWADEHGIPGDLPAHAKTSAKGRLAEAMNKKKAAKSRR